MRMGLLFCLLSTSVLAGSFEDYEWRLTFKPGGGYFQPLLKIDYTYKADGSYENGMIALPRDSNLTVYKLTIKVDGDKVEGVPAIEQTYWSHGDRIPVILPPPGGEKISVSAVYVIRNLFVVPAAPTSFTIPVKKLESGFAPMNGFSFSAIFEGPKLNFKRNRVAGRPGEPKSVFMLKRKNVKAAERPGLFHVIPKLFEFDFELLVGVNSELDGVASTDIAAGGGDLSRDSLKPYNMMFYNEQPARDWKYMPTWLQQADTYLPFGIEPGGRNKNRSLFVGAGSDTSELLSWRMDPKDEEAFEELPNEVDMEFDGVFPSVETLLKGFRELVVVQEDGSPMIAAQDKDKLTPARANLVLATLLSKRLGLRAVPALMTDADQKLMARLPASGFSRVLTAFNHKKSWYFIDAADPSWLLKNSFEKLTGRRVLILDGDNLQVASY